MRYTVTEHLVSQANPIPTPFVWTREASAIDAMAVIARIVSQTEEESEHFDQFTTRASTITIQVTEA